jgi:hypothetical protein
MKRRFFVYVTAAAWMLAAAFSLSITSQASVTVTNLSPSFGTVGTAVTIYGTSFGGPRPTVQFTGPSGTLVNATVSSWTGTTIKVTVPSTAVTGVVEVTPSGRSTASSSIQFVVLATKAGLAMGAFPPTGTACSGIIGYNGTNCYRDYLNDVVPNIDGVVVVANWSTMDPGNGNAPCFQPGGSTNTCDFSSLDTAVNDFVTASTWGTAKKVGIVISPVSNGDGVANCTKNCNGSTPAYVFTSAWATTAGGSGTPPQEECTCGDYTGDNSAPQNQCWNSSTNSDITGFPVVYQAPFSVALQDFHDALISHLNSVSYSSYIAYVRLGTAGGGEEYPHCSSTIKSQYGISDSTFETDWTNYSKTIFNNASTQGAEYPLMAAPNGNGTTTGDPSDGWADAEADYALAAGLVLGSEGLQSNDIFISNCDTSTSTSGGSSNDWCYTFSSAFDTAYSVAAPVVRESQTLMYSDPAEGAPTTNLNCLTDYYNAGNTQSQNTGSLVCLLPFVEGKANSVELYPEDVFLAFDSNTTNYSTYGSYYATAISNLRAGR